MFVVIRNVGKLSCQRKSFKNLTLLRRQKADYISSSLPTIEIPNSNVPEYVFQDFDKCPNAIAVDCDLTGKKYTFDDIRFKTRNFNTNLRKKLKLKKGDVIAVLLPNVADYPICVFGAMEAGLVVTPINPFFTSGEIKRQLLDSNSKAIVTLTSLYQTAQHAACSAELSIPILTIKTKHCSITPEGAIDISEFTQTKSDIKKVTLSPEELVLLLYSSGTTGIPKGVEHSHQTIIANICQLNVQEFQHFPIRSATHENKHLAVLPWFHIYGNTAILTLQLHKLTKLICIPKFTPESFRDALVEHKPNGLHAVPPLILFLTNNPVIKSEYLQQIISIIYGSEHLSKHDIDNFLNKVDKKVYLIQGYGLTETNGVCYTSMERYNYDNVGIMEPLPNTSIKVISDKSDSVGLGPNKVGEILVKGPQVMKKYHNRPNETAKTFLNGWFRTGDLGYYDDIGLVYVSDRIKDIIKVNSFQVAPAELEEVIRGYQDVMETAVIGIPDKRYGEVPLAFVVPKPNSRLNTSSLQKYVDSKVVKYKQLKGGVILVDSLPKNSTGKVARKTLAELFRKGSFAFNNISLKN